MDGGAYRAIVHGDTKNRKQLKRLSTRTYLIFFFHSSIDEYLGCFHFLATVNSAAVNTGAHVSFQIMIFSADYFLFCLCSALLCKKLVSLIRSHPFVFVFIVIAPGGGSNKILL